MPYNREMTLNEALLMYTEAKLEIAAKFRKGISYSDFSEFERKMEMLEDILNREASKLHELLEKGSNYNVN